MIKYAQQLGDTIDGAAYYGDAFISPLVHCAEHLTYDDRLCLLRYQLGRNTELDCDSINAIINKLKGR